jgi:hypothetical protein
LWSAGLLLLGWLHRTRWLLLQGQMVRQRLLHHAGLLQAHAMAMLLASCLVALLLGQVLWQRLLQQVLLVF